MAYSIMIEPFFPFQKKDGNDKIKIGNWSNEMYYTIKRNAPDHLVTQGLQMPETVINWDYAMQPTDFMSLTFYGIPKNVTKSVNILKSYNKWFSDNYEGIWTIMETGFSGTDIISEQDSKTGTEQNQKDFSLSTMQNTIDCGCNSYAWWQYQEVDWRGSPTDSYQENHFGLITRWPDEQNKKIVDVFSNYSNLTKNSSNCIRPSNYYNLTEENTYKLYGWVKDQFGNPIQDAVIVFW